jgi:hypothetical protein
MLLWIASYLSRWDIYTTSSLIRAYVLNAEVLNLQHSKSPFFKLKIWILRCIKEEGGFNPFENIVQSTTEKQSKKRKLKDGSRSI